MWSVCIALICVAIGLVVLANKQQDVPEAEADIETFGKALRLLTKYNCSHDELDPRTKDTCFRIQLFFVKHYMLRTQGHAKHSSENKKEVLADYTLDHGIVSENELTEKTSCTVNNTDSYLTLVGLHKYTYCPLWLGKYYDDNFGMSAHVTEVEHKQLGDQTESDKNAKQGSEQSAKTDGIFLSTLHDFVQGTADVVADINSLPERRLRMLQNNGTDVYAIVLTQAYRQLTQLDEVKDASALFFSYIWIPIEDMYSEADNIITVGHGYINFVLKKGCDTLGQILATVLGYPFHGLAISCSYVVWAIGSVFNIKICSFIISTGEYILELPLNLAGEVLQMGILYLCKLMIFILVDVVLVVLIMGLKLVIFITCYSLNVTYFVLYGPIYITVPLLKLLIIYPLTLIPFLVIENVYVMTFIVTFTTAAVYVMLCVLTCKILRWAYAFIVNNG